MKSSWLLIALGASACADPVIEMSLQMPSASQMPANFDLSCITTVEVLVMGHQQESQDAPADTRYECVDLAKAPTSLQDLRNQISGKFDLKLPESGLAGVQLRGAGGRCADKNRYYEAHVYGGAPYRDGSESLTIPVLANISCNARRTYTASTIDLLALGTTKQCATSIPAPTQSPIVFAGNVRPQMLGDEFDRMSFENGPSVNTPDAQGKVVIESYTAAGPKACVALGYGSPEELSGTCINASAPTLCAGPNEIELAVIDQLIASSSIDTSLVLEYGEPLFGAVWKQSPATTVTKQQVQGAIVTLEDPTQGKVVYVTPANGRLVPIQGATSTGPDGLFIIYLKGEATNVTVKAGPSSQRYTVTSQGDLPPVLLAVLP